MTWDNLIPAKAENEVIRASAVLTTSYVALTPIAFDGYKTLILWCKFTKGNSTGYRIKIEKSDDGVTYFREPEKTQAGGFSSYATNEHERVVSDATENIEIPITPIEAKYVKVSVLAITSEVGTLLEITAKKSCLEY